MYSPCPTITSRRVPAVALRSVLRSYDVYGPSVKRPGLHQITINSPNIIREKKFIYTLAPMNGEGGVDSLFQSSKILGY